MGGPWALQWAVAHPDRFASATMLNGGVAIGVRWHRWARLYRIPIVGELLIAAMTRPAFRIVTRLENPRLSRGQIDRLYDAFGGWGTRRTVLKLYRSDPGPELLGLADALHRLDRPALVVWGTADAYWERKQAEPQHRSFPSARVELLDAHGHWAFLEDRERVASLVVPFLRDQVAVG